MRTGRVVVIGGRPIDSADEGGTALDVAVGLSRLGVSATLVAGVADDAVRALLAAEGVRLLEPADARRIDAEEDVVAAVEDAPLVVVAGPWPLAGDGAADLLVTVADPAERLVLVPGPRHGWTADAAATAEELARLAPSARVIAIADADVAVLEGEDPEAAATRLAGDGARLVLATADAGAIVAVGGAVVRATAPDEAGPIAAGAADAALASILDAVLRAEVQGMSDALYWEAALENAITIAGATARGAGPLLRLP